MNGYLDAYYRVSSKTQKDEGYSLESQQSIAKQVAKGGAFKAGWIYLPNQREAKDSSNSRQSKRCLMAPLLSKQPNNRLMKSGNKKAKRIQRHLQRTYTREPSSYPQQAKQEEAFLQRNTSCNCFLGKQFLSPLSKQY